MRGRRTFALLLAVVAFVPVVLAQRQQGIARDEVLYRFYGRRYIEWWGSLFSGREGTRTPEMITRHFGGPSPIDNNREHPPLVKLLVGLSERVFSEWLGWASATTASRLPGAGLNALLVALVMLFTASLWGLAEGVIAGLLTLLLPRAFFHAGLATLDMPVAALWFATIYCYHRALDSPRWCLILGLVFGLALSTKHNALLLIVVCGAHYAGVAQQRRRLSADGHGARGARAWLQALRQRQPLLAPAMLVVAPLVVLALWPWLWFDTFTHVAEWLRFHLQHVNYNFEYLGRNYQLPPFPWHVPLVTTALTVPVVTVVSAALGTVVIVRRARLGQAVDPDRAPGLLLLTSALAALLPFALRTTPIFGAEKHWAAAIPSICIVAAIGLVTAARWASAALLVGRRARLVVRVLLCAVALAAAAAETVVAQPYAPTHYNALAGGAPGGADMGMNRQFWGYAARGVLTWLNRHAAARAVTPLPVYAHDANLAWEIYQREGLLAPALSNAGFEGDGVRHSQYALVIHERHFALHDTMIWREYGTVRPAYVLTTSGVPIVSVYARPPAPRAAPAPASAPTASPSERR